MDHSDASAFAWYKRLGCTIVSLDLTWDAINNRKKPNFHSPWMTEPRLIPNSKDHAMVCGAVSKVTVIDIDDASLPHNQQLKELCEAAGAAKQTTRKGFHYAFSYTELLKTTTGGPGLCFDIRNDGSVIFCEPCSYTTPDNVQHCYSWSSKPETLPECNETILDLVVGLLGNRGKVPERSKGLRNSPEYQRLQQEKRAAKEVSKTGITNNLQIEDITLLLDSIDEKHADVYQDWLTVGMALHHAGHSWELFDKFSRRSERYKEDNNECYYLFQKFHRSPEDKVVTLATLYFWLKTENPEVFGMLVGREYENEYNQMKTEFELKNFFIGTELFHMNEVENISVVRPSEAKTYFANKKIRHYDGTKTCKKDFYDLWKQDEDRRSYDRRDCWPDVASCPPNVYNTFTGFAGEALQTEFEGRDIEGESEYVDLIVRHVDLLTKGHVDFFMRWMASIVQRPGMKTETAIVLRDMKRLLMAAGGTGKNKFVEWFGNSIIGSKYFCVIANNAVLFTRFSEHLESKFLVFVEEACGDENLKHIEEFKAYITATTVLVEKKHENKYVMNSFANFILATNQVNPVPVYGASQSDRRFCFFDVDTKYQNNREYFSTLHEHLSRKEAAASFYRYLKSYGSWTSPNDIAWARPVTRAFVNIRWMNAGPIIQWLVHCMESNIAIDGTVTSLYEEFNKWLLEEQPERRVGGALRIPGKRAFVHELTSNPDICKGHNSHQVRKRTSTAVLITLDSFILRKTFIENYYMEADCSDVRDGLVVGGTASTAPSTTSSMAMPSPSR